MASRLSAATLRFIYPRYSPAVRYFYTVPHQSLLFGRPLRFQFPNSIAWQPVASPLQQSVRTMFIQTEPTPNPDALKFIPGTPVLPAGASSMEYLDGRDTHNSPLARKLFAVDGVRAVFYGPDFITITKSEDANWAFLKPEVFSLITEVLNSGSSVVTEGTTQAEDTMPKEGDSEVVGMIKELLDTRIRPAIQEGMGFYIALFLDVAE